MAKRVFLFVATNIAILVTVSIVMAVLQATGLIDTRAGLSQGALMVFCLVWGMGASLVSLALSRKIAKWSMGVKLVNGQTGNADLDWLLRHGGPTEPAGQPAHARGRLLRIARGERLRDRARARTAAWWRSRPGSSRR